MVEATCASAFSIDHVWRGLSNLKRGRDLATLHSRFTALARLAGNYSRHCKNMILTLSTALAPAIISRMHLAGGQIIKRLQSFEKQGTSTVQRHRGGRATRGPTGEVQKPCPYFTDVLVALGGLDRRVGQRNATKAAHKRVKLYVLGDGAARME